MYLYYSLFFTVFLACIFMYCTNIIDNNIRKSRTGQGDDKTLNNITLILVRFKNCRETHLDYNCHGILKYVTAFWVVNTDQTNMTDTNQFRKFHSYTGWHIPKNSLKTQEKTLSTKIRRPIFNSRRELFDWRSNPDGTMYHPVIPATEWQSWVSNPLHLEDIIAGWMANYERNTVHSPVLLDRLDF